MKPKRYRRLDYAQLQNWTLARGQEMPPPDHLPKNGWLIDGVAAIFLIRTDSAVGFLEYFVTNPWVSDKERLKACDLLIVAALTRAKQLKIKTVVGNTAIPKVMALGLRYGFKSDGKPYIFFRKTIGETINERRIDEPAELHRTASPSQ